jgi:hypothetical protein
VLGGPEVFQNVVLVQRDILDAQDLQPQQRQSANKKHSPWWESRKAAHEYASLTTSFR